MANLEQEAKDYMATKRKTAGGKSQAEKDRILTVAASVLGGYLTSVNARKLEYNDHLLAEAYTWAEALVNYQKEKEDNNG